MKNILAIQSHVVFGHAGNSAAEFPMRRLGANVWPLNTVQFSNHTQYGKWTGCVMPPSHLTEIVRGIADIDKLQKDLELWNLMIVERFSQLKKNLRIQNPITVSQVFISMIIEL